MIEGPGCREGGGAISKGSLTGTEATLSKTGVMVCGHGSRDAGAGQELANVVAKIAARLPEYEVNHGFLEFARPIIREGLDDLRTRGCDNILAIPGMLFAAGHVKNDVPSVLNTYSAATGVPIHFGRDLGIDPRLLRAARDRISTALAQAEGDVPMEDTLLVVVGRGTSDADANGDICKVARMLWEGMGFPWAEVVYSGVTQPRVDSGLIQALRLGYRRVVVFPWFLFTGVLIQRIYRLTNAVAAANPGVQFIKAGYLGDHPEVIETFVERVRGIGSGDVNMNCQLCKYRTQIIGYESSVGLAQESHHHHVEGIGSGEGHDHVHGHHHHGDSHHHHGHDHHHHQPDVGARPPQAAKPLVETE